MSYTRMYGVPAEGPMIGLHRYGNAWGSAPLIWNYLGEMYHGLAHSTGEHELAVIFGSLGKGLYRPHEEVCLNLTADKCIVRKADFQRVSRALYLMHDLTFKLGQVNHLATIAGDLMLAEHFEDYIGVAFMWTSVADVVWYAPMEEPPTAEEEELQHGSRMWDISRDKGHWFLFEADLTEQVKEATEGPTLCDYLVETRLRVHAAISDSAPRGDLEHRAMAREILNLRNILKVFKDKFENARESNWERARQANVEQDQTEEKAAMQRMNMWSDLLKLIETT